MTAHPTSPGRWLHPISSEDAHVFPATATRGALVHDPWTGIHAAGRRSRRGSHEIDRRPHRSRLFGGQFHDSPWASWPLRRGKPKGRRDAFTSIVSPAAMIITPSSSGNTAPWCQHRWPGGRRKGGCSDSAAPAPSVCLTFLWSPFVSHQPL